MNNKLRNTMKWIDVHREFDIPFTNKTFQFEIVKSDPNAVKYFVPALGYTKRKNICFAVVLFFWNKRVLFRIVADTTKADRFFKWRKQIK